MRWESPFRFLYGWEPYEDIIPNNDVVMKHFISSVRETAAIRRPSPFGMDRRIQRLVGGIHPETIRQHASIAEWAPSRTRSYTSLEEINDQGFEDLALRDFVG